MGGECSGAASPGIRQHLLQDDSAWSPSFPLRTLLVGVGVGVRRVEEGVGSVEEGVRSVEEAWESGRAAVCI